MPRYSCHEHTPRFEGAVDVFAALPALSGYADVLDAKGNLIDRNLIYFDTDTGIVVARTLTRVRRSNTTSSFQTGRGNGCNFYQTDRPGTLRQSRRTR